jgi:hypothetical protein
MWYHSFGGFMSKSEKQLEKMRKNPRDWTIDDLKVIAKRCNLDFRQPGSSHVTFRSKNGSKVTVPAHKPIKPVYIKQFIELIDEQGETENE